jgi:hypothetical protein
MYFVTPEQDVAWSRILVLPGVEGNRLHHRRRVSVLGIID